MIPNYKQPINDAPTLLTRPTVDDRCAGADRGLGLASGSTPSPPPSVTASAGPLVVCCVVGVARR